MPLYVVTYDHPDTDGWSRHLVAHIGWLQDRLLDGTLLASGPFTASVDRAAMLVFATADRGALDAVVMTDPFAVEGLIANLTVREWDPIFGAFNARSTRPGQLQTRYSS